MSSDITSITPEKKALTGPSREKAVKRRKKKAVSLVWVTSEAFDEKLDAAETEWLTIKAFAEDPRFGGSRHPTGLQKAVDANRCGLRQSRRPVTVQVPCRAGHFRPCTHYVYALWRIEEWVGYKVARRRPPAPPPSIGPLKRSVQFTSPTPQEEETYTPIPRPRIASDLIFIPPPAQLELETCGADNC